MGILIFPIAPAWERISRSHRAGVGTHWRRASVVVYIAHTGRWRVQNGLPRQRVGTRKNNLPAKQLNLMAKSSSTLKGTRKMGILFISTSLTLKI